MLVIGITGGVGAGKSEILDILHREYDACIIQADRIAKKLEEPGQPGFERLVELFGREILNVQGKVDSQVLAEKIFHDSKALEQINQVIHPLTWKVIQEQLGKCSQEFAVVEAALFGEESKALCKYLVYIDTDEKIRISRLMESRGYTREKCLAIMKNQKSRSEFLKLADYVIYNNDSLDDTKKQIKEIINSIKKREHTHETC